MSGRGVSANNKAYIPRFIDIRGMKTVLSAERPTLRKQIVSLYPPTLCETYARHQSIVQF